MSLLNREIFWPPADELTEVAERIRGRLGDWPAWLCMCTASRSPGRLNRQSYRCSIAMNGET